jgi:hypothetical protein
VVDQKSIQEIWLPVIGNALAFLCLDKYSEKNPDKSDSVLKKVKFLKGLGVPDNDAAGAAGSTAESVRVMKAQRGGKRHAARK